MLLICPYSLPLRHPDLAAVCRDKRTLIMYPGPGAQNLEKLLLHNQPDPEARTAGHNVILIDGTWSQAKDIFLRNNLLHLPTQVCKPFWMTHCKRTINKCWCSGEVLSQLIKSTMKRSLYALSLTDGN